MKTNIRQTVRKIIREELLTESDYYLLPKKVVNNELRKASELLNNVYQGARDGDALSPGDEFDDLISSLKKIKNKLKSIPQDDDPPKGY